MGSPSSKSHHEGSVTGESSLPAYSAKFERVEARGESDRHPLGYTFASSTLAAGGRLHSKTFNL